MATIALSLTFMEALDKAKETGEYRVRKFEVKNSKVICFMVHTMMCIDESAYHTVGSLNNAALFFPFTYTVDKTDLMDDGSFVFSNFG